VRPDASFDEIKDLVEPTEGPAIGESRATNTDTGSIGRSVSGAGLLLVLRTAAGNAGCQIIEIHNGTGIPRIERHSIHTVCEGKIVVSRDYHNHFVLAEVFGQLPSPSSGISNNTLTG
jgi:hypothetical protein